MSILSNSSHPFNISQIEALQRLNDVAEKPHLILDKKSQHLRETSFFESLFEKISDSSSTLREMSGEQKTKVTETPAIKTTPDSGKKTILASLESTCPIQQRLFDVSAADELKNVALSSYYKILMGK